MFLKKSNSAFGFRILSLSFLLVLIFSWRSFSAAEQEMSIGRPEARSLSSEGYVLEIRIKDYGIEFLAKKGQESDSVRFDAQEVKIDTSGLWVDKKIMIDDEGVWIKDKRIKGEDIGEIIVEKAGNFKMTMVLADEVMVEKRSKLSKAIRITSDDVVKTLGDIEIGKDEIIEGDVVTLGGDIYVDGKVKGDVVTIFGDIRLGSAALVWGDVASINGKVYKEKTSKVKGDISESDTWKFEKKLKEKYWRRKKTMENFDFGLSIVYNRIEGLDLGGTLKFKEEHHKLPTIKLSTSFGFSSKDWKYDLGFSQKVFDKEYLTFGGNIYKLTDTPDEWIMGTSENTLAGIFLNEDFRDYYRREGGLLYISQNIGKENQFKVEYRRDRYFWVDKNTDWSLFGKGKHFRKNFSSLPDSVYDFYVENLEGDMSSIIGSYTFDTRDDKDYPTSGWYNRLEIEKAGGNLGEEFWFSRYLLTIIRYQPLTFRQFLNLRMIYGHSDDDLPLQKLFFLGGIGTLRGYRFKEFYGNKMFLANVEYVADFHRSGFQGVVFVDVGKTQLSKDIFDSSPFKTGVGIGIKTGHEFRLDIAKRLDDFEAPLQVTFRVSKMF